MTDGKAPELIIERNTATIVLRRVKEHNRIDPDDTAILVEHFRTVMQTPGMSALVLTGEGERTFCSGYTLAKIGSRLDRGFEDMLDQLESLPIPTICALNGSVYGGGADLAIGCDFRIGVEGMRMFVPAARFGLHYFPGGLRRFVSRVGAPAAKKIFLTGLPLDAQELLRIGYLTEIVQPLHLQQRVKEYTDALSLGDADAVASMKLHIDALACGADYENEGRRAYEQSLRSESTARRLSQLA